MNFFKKLLQGNFFGIVRDDLVARWRWHGSGRYRCSWQADMSCCTGATRASGCSRIRRDAAGALAPV